MQSKRPVIAGFRSMTFAGRTYQVPLYIHRRLGVRDGWCVNIHGIKQFFADEEHGIQDALVQAKALLAAILRYDVATIERFAPIIVRVGVSKHGNSYVTGVFKNANGCDQEAGLVWITANPELTVGCEYKLQELPSWIAHLDYSEIVALWIADLKLSLNNVFYPAGFSDFINKTLQATPKQLSLV